MTSSGDRISYSVEHYFRGQSTLVIMIIGIILLSIVIDMSLACSCMSRPAEDIFCSEQIALKGKPVSEKEIMDGYYVIRREFVFEVDKVYKDESGLNIQAGGSIEVSTAGDGGLCGVGLNIGEEYFLSGDAYKGQMQVGLCGWNSNFKYLSNDEIRGINGGYRCGSSD